jgi:hypothetical protein
MADMRCPKHDRIFETLTDHRKPGAGATATLAAHPFDGHPDCPKCVEDLVASVATPADIAAAKRARARAAADAAAEAARVAREAADDAEDASAQVVNSAQTAGRRIG